MGQWLNWIINNGWRAPPVGWACSLVLKLVQVCCAYLTSLSCQAYLQVEKDPREASALTVHMLDSRFFSLSLSPSVSDALS